MNLEINIKVPLGGADVSVAQSGAAGAAVAAAQPSPEPAQVIPPDAFPPALDPARALPWGEPQRQAPNGEEAMSSSAPPSLADMGVTFEPRPDVGPPSLLELGTQAGFAPANGGVPPGLEGLDLPAAAVTGLEPPPPPELELEAQAESARHVPPLPDELIKQAAPNKGSPGKHRKD